VELHEALSSGLVQVLHFVAASLSVELHEALRFGLAQVLHVAAASSLELLQALSSGLRALGNEHTPSLYRIWRHHGYQVVVELSYPLR